MLGTVRRHRPEALQRSRLDPEEHHRPAAEMSLPDDGNLRIAHRGPALQRRPVGIDRSPHHRANVERLLAAGVALVGEDVADPRQLRIRRRVRRRTYITIGRVGGRRAAGEAFARRHVGVLVVREQQPAGGLDVRRPILGLAVWAHDPLVAADAEVVLGGDAAGVIQRLLPVSTMALSGVITSIPRVCISIVASAFQ